MNEYILVLVVSSLYMLFFFLSDGEDAVYNCIENYQYISQVRIRDSDPTPSFLTHQYKDLSMYIFLVGK